MSLLFPDWQPNIKQTEFGENTYVDNKDLDTLFAQVKAEQEEIWAREDSAYQRMVEDMRKAGLNPWTGISTGGLSSSAASPTSTAFSTLSQALDAIFKGESNIETNHNNLAKNLIKLFTSFVGFIGNTF